MLAGRPALGAGFDPGRPAVVSSTGVSMYLTKSATAATLRRLATLATGSTVVMTFFVPLDLADEADRPGLEMSARGAGSVGHAVRQLLRTRRDRRMCARRRVREALDTSHQPPSPTATSRIEPTDSAHRPARTC